MLLIKVLSPLLRRIGGYYGQMATADDLLNLFLPVDHVSQLVLIAFGQVERRKLLGTF